MSEENKSKHDSSQETMIGLTVVFCFVCLVVIGVSVGAVWEYVNKDKILERKARTEVENFAKQIDTQNKTVAHDIIKAASEINRNLYIMHQVDYGNMPWMNTDEVLGIKRSLDSLELVQRAFLGNYERNEWRVQRFADSVARANNISMEKIYVKEK